MPIYYNFIQIPQARPTKTWFINIILKNTIYSNARPLPLKHSNHLPVNPPKFFLSIKWNTIFMTLINFTVVQREKSTISLYLTQKKKVT